MLQNYEIKKGGHGPFYFYYGCHGNQVLKMGKPIKHLLLRNYRANLNKISQKCSLEVLLTDSIIYLLFSVSTSCCHDNQILKTCKNYCYSDFPNFRQFVAMATRILHGSLQYIGIWKRTTKGTFLWNLVEIGSVFPEEKVCKAFPSFKHLVVMATRIRNWVHEPYWYNWIWKRTT